MDPNLAIHSAPLGSERGNESRRWISAASCRERGRNIARDAYHIDYIRIPRTVLPKRGGVAFILEKGGRSGRPLVTMLYGYRS